MKVKSSILLFIILTILSGCNVVSSGSNTPKDISKEHYKTFVKSYKLYEERVQQYNGQFVDEKGELIDFKEKGIFPDSDILGIAWEDKKRKEKGEKGVLTNKENEIINDFLSLYFIKQLDFMTEDLKQMSISKNPEYANPVQAAINLEQKVIDILELEKEPVTASLKENDRMTNKVNSSRDIEEKQQTIDQDEPEKKTVEQDQKTADEVQEYVVNIINDLTIVENMSSDIQSSDSYSKVYGSSYSKNKGNGPDYNKQFNKSIKMMKKALIDLHKQRAPKNTEYIVLEPALKQYINDYQKIIDDIENSNNTTTEAIHELQALDLKIQNVESSLADSIIANNYAEYDALLYIWKKGGNYRTKNNTHAVIPSGIKMEFLRNGVDFAQDLEQN
ncbi:hypothetical protein ICR95_28235 (plasmid) [Priestia megaterium]|uniref:hypothetical protein n=1 Tax=Priestia megaterium TaxID=1404 RepID=UPI00196AB1E2|nr:hypothetical protein [Priestia megaterium]QSF36386.1 hypothetical protein ICR95_28235 [Priestia megaterium]